MMTASKDFRELLL